MSDIPNLVALMDLFCLSEVGFVLDCLFVVLSLRCLYKRLGLQTRLSRSLSGEIEAVEVT